MDVKAASRTRRRTSARSRSPPHRPGTQWCPPSAREIVETDSGFRLARSSLRVPVMATRTRPEPLTAEQREVVRETARYADTWVALRARTQRVPGVQVAVAVAGDVLLPSAHGFARLPGTNGEDDAGEPLTTSHLFRIASHSKTFTATAVMQLVEAGKLRLDDTAGEHVAALEGT